ncbi:UNVERIFIED_CONTAM: hypothetical protein GTU68_012508 [Idotea baltica]|nr:hypothetical protein [Idotea baltica]
MSERLLIVDDDVDICFLLSGYFNGLGYETEYSFLGEGGLKLLREKKFDAVLCDYRLPDRDGFEMLKAIRKEHPTLPVIIITGYSDVKTAVNVIKYGAFDYVTKPILPEEILQKVKEAIADRGSEEEKPKAKKTPNGYVQGVSTAACKLEEMISLVGPTNMTVIVQGETGSGKENVARSLHNASPRKGKPFLALDCGALPDDLAASELFGHKKGSFTGAIADKDGFFVHADGGTLFLDEIGNLSYDIQVQLLRVIQERKVRRMGETSHRDIDVRLVVATNEDLKAAAEEGSFREDLYHRLNEFFIEVPPLRKRGEDILLFADFFLRKSNEELSKDVKAFDEKAKALVQEYDWPGNLRELQNVIKRAVLLCSDAEIGTKHFPMEVVNALQGADQDLEVNDLKSAAEKAEYEMILKALKEAKYNKGKAAKALGVDRKTLYNKMKQFNIS